MSLKETSSQIGVDLVMKAVWSKQDARSVVFLRCLHLSYILFSAAQNVSSFILLSRRVLDSEVEQGNKLSLSRLSSVEHFGSHEVL